MKERPKRGSDPPLQGLSELSEVLAGFSVGVLLGALGGLLFAEYLRARGLRWTWVFALALPAMATCALAIASPLEGWAAGLGVGIAGGSFSGAVAWGLYQRIEDRRAGGDREVRAGERRGVLDFARRLFRERPAQRDQAIAEGIPLGRTERGELSLIRRGTRRSGSHVLIPGATGAGKTTSLAALLIEYVVRSGFGAVVIEAKIDERLRAAAEAAAEARGVAFHLVSPSGSSGYDPIAQGSVDERSERLIAVQPWGSDDADFYRQAASPFLRLAVRALDAGAGPTTLRTVAQSCHPDLLEEVLDGLEEEQLMEEIINATKALTVDERRAVGGLRARLFNLADSDFAREWLDPKSTKGPVVDLRRSVGAGEIVYFRLDTDRTGNVGEAIAQMVMLDLGAIASAMMGKGVGTFIAIDEFGAIKAEALERLYTRGRSAGMSVALGTQTVADLREAGATTRERVGATIEAIVCHRIGNQEDAEWIAELVGTVPAWQTTTRTDALGLSKDEGTRTRGHRFEVHPSQLQRLDSGQAYVARLDESGSRRARSVHVVPPWKRLPAMEARS
jgi:type IV secretory system conjugative DNA transfer VirD4/TraG family protein